MNCKFSCFAWIDVSFLLLQRCERLLLHLFCSPDFREPPKVSPKGLMPHWVTVIGEWAVQIMQRSLIKLKGWEVENASPIVQISKSRIYPAVTGNILRFKRIFWQFVFGCQSAPDPYKWFQSVTQWTNMKNNVTSNTVSITMFVNIVGVCQ